MKKPSGDMAAGHWGHNALTCLSQVFTLARKKRGSVYSVLPICSFKPLSAIIGTEIQPALIVQLLQTSHM